MELKKLINCLLYSAIVGVLGGTVLFFFRLFSTHSMHYSKEIYSFIQLNPIYIPLFFIFLFILSITMYSNLKFEKNASGGGISRSIGLIQNLLKPLNSFKIIIATIFGSFISFIGGLSLGAEGPSVYIGTLLGNSLYENSSKSDLTLKKAVNTAGAGSGFTAALGTPISAIIFSIEETHEYFNKYMLLFAIVGVIFASIFGYSLSSLFNVEYKLLDISGTSFDIASFYIPILIGIVSSFLALIYNFILINGIKLFNHLKKKKSLNFLIILFAFFLTGISGLLFNDLTGSGFLLILNVLDGNYILYILLIIIIAKIILITISTSSGSTGGLFLPTLVVGALCGGIIAEILTTNGISNSYYSTIILISIVSFISSSADIPITGILFAFELSNDLYIGIWAILAIIISLSIFKILKGKSLNKSILNILIKNDSKAS